MAFESNRRRPSPPPLSPLPDSFEACYRDHWWPMVRLAAGLVDDRVAAEDVVQEAFTAVYRRWDAVANGNPVAYLRTSVVNAARSALRRRRTVRRHLRVAEPEHGPAADEGVARWGEREDLTAALAGLPQRQREVVVLRYVSQLTDAEIAEATGLSAGGVRSASSRGLTALRTRMGDRS